MSVGPTSSVRPRVNPNGFLKSKTFLITGSRRDHFFWQDLWPRGVCAVIVRLAKTHTHIVFLETDTLVFRGSDHGRRELATIM